MALNVDHLLRTAATLEQALLELNKVADVDSVLFDLFRNAAIKSFDLSLETTTGPACPPPFMRISNAPTSCCQKQWNTRALLDDVRQLKRNWRLSTK